MDLRSEVFSHQEKLWILCIGQESTKKPLSPLLDMIDWYNNQLLAKGILQNQIATDLGSKTLLGVTGILPLSRLLIFGIGNEKDLGPSQAKNILSMLDTALEGLNETTPWIIFPNHTPQEFIAELSKGKTHIERLTHSSVWAQD